MKNGLTFVSLALISLAAASMLQAEVITPDNLDTWQLIGTDSSGVTCVGPCGTASFVSGPATPPEGIGSVDLNSPGSASAQLGTTSLNGILLSSLTDLTYSTYDTFNNGQQFPYIRLDLSYDGGTQFDQWFFEPTYQNVSGGGANCTSNQATPILNTWQTWDASGGCWWDNNSTATAGNTPATPMLTLAQIIAAEPDAVIVGSTNAFNDGLRFRVGLASDGTQNFDGNVDNVTIGVNGVNTNYDFEPAAATPEPGTFGLLGGGLILLGGVARRSRTRLARA